MRLFAAIRIDDEVREHLVRALRPIREDRGPMLRWTDPEQWHLTLAFYGEQPDGRAAELGELLRTAAVPVPPLGLRLRGAGSFAGRTLWMGVGGEVDRLRALMADLADPADPGGAGDPLAARRRAHLTVARLGVRAERRAAPARPRRGRRTTPAAFDDIVAALAVYRGPDFTVDRIGLYRSELGRGRSGGPLHELVAEHPLLGAGEAGGAT